MQCLRNIRRSLYNATTLKNDASSGCKADARKHRADVQVVVVGAGLAGLSAASHLIKNGFRRTVVLEATERYGGRVNSQHFGDTFCELGAKWISIDASKDSVYELLRQATGLQKKLHQKNELLYVNSWGQKINRKIPELVDTLFRKVCSGIELKQKYKTGDLHDLNNVHTYFQSETRKLIESLFHGDEQSIANDIFTSLTKEFASLLGCCLEYVNIEHITNLHRPLSTPIYIPTGLDNLLGHITKDIRSDHMRVGKPVGQIKWYGASNYDQKSVGCMDGSLFNADHIICTLPLGVLKNFSNYIFKPLLPKAKLAAIRNLGFGSPVKIYFEYEDSIRMWFPTSVRPLWSTQEQKKDLKWTKQVVEIAKVPTSSRVLEILVGGAFYDEIENLPDAELLSEITKLLRTCLNNAKVPYPKSALRSNWSSCACYLGGRPYFSTGSGVNDVATLAAPLGDTPSLLFAGDATIVQGFGTIDGARMSGIREAKRIIDFYAK